MLAPSAASGQTGGEHRRLHRRRGRARRTRSPASRCRSRRAGSTSCSRRPSCTSAPSTSTRAGPVSGAQATDCYLTGTYVGQETSALDVDLLNPTPQPFPAPAVGVTEPPALVEQVWLTGPDINNPADATPILIIAGTATEGAATFPFTGTVTIGSNHAPSSSASAGGDSICKQRIVSPIQEPVTIEKTGGLLLRIDPRTFFVDVDFSQLPADPTTGGYAFSDDPSDSAAYAPTGQNLYSNLRSTAPYQFSWSTDL